MLAIILIVFVNSHSNLPAIVDFLLLGCPAFILTTSLFQFNALSFSLPIIYIEHF